MLYAPLAEPRQALATLIRERESGPSRPKGSDGIWDEERREGQSHVALTSVGQPITGNLRKWHTPTGLVELLISFALCSCPSIYSFHLLQSPAHYSQGFQPTAEPRIQK